MWAGTVTPVSRSATEDDPATTGPSCGPQCAATSLFTYSSDRIKDLSIQPYHIPRATRKILFLYGIWRPRTGRPILGQRLAGPAPPKEPESALPSTPAAASPINGLQLVTWNIHSLSQKRSSLRGSIFSWSPSRGTVLRLTWRFVDLSMLR